MFRGWWSQASLAIAAATLLGCSLDKSGIYPVDGSSIDDTFGARGGAAGAAGADGVAGGGAAAGAGGRGGRGGAGGMATGGAGTAGSGPAGRGGGAGGVAGGGGLSPCSAYPAAQAFRPPGAGVHCYWLHVQRYRWPDAEYTCESERGALATSLSSAENTFLAQLTTTTVWIGGSDGRESWDNEAPGQYAWITSEPFTYQSWAPTQPDGRCEGCVGGSADGCVCEHRIALGPDGRWIDDWDGALHPFLCEATPGG